ncbi:MAG: hypothetical protein QOH88_3179 [Verrucomicrobiota bacterium]|jgi:hypothetical protein
MAVFMSLAGNTSGNGFLLAPLDSTYDAVIELWTDTGPSTVTLQASPNGAGLVFSQTAVNISAAHTVVTVHATLQSAVAGDTTIEVRLGMALATSFVVTSIKHPVVNFRGRFEARFATQPAFYNQNPMYAAANEVVGPGWTWALEGEPAFVPASGNVPTDLEMTGVGRVVRLNNPVALRSHVDAVASSVESISGETGAGPVTFTVGDPLIGQLVNFGPDTYLAGNRNIDSGDPTPEEFFTDAEEPLGLFQLHFGAMFSGASQVGPFTHKATMQDEKTRTPDSRPIAVGLAGAAVERAEIGLPSLQTFSETRIDLLVTDYNALPAGASPARRNLVRRIGHLLSVVGLAKRNAIQAANPGAFTVRPGTIPVGWTGKEEFDGKVDTDLTFTPSGSAVVTYMAEFQSFNVHWTPFAFHSDELCAYHKGSCAPDLTFHGSYTGDPHTHTVNGIAYDFQSVGEFTLLRDGGTLEVQVRQSPVPSANPVTDGYSGLTACVSVITAVAARVGAHRISLQPAREGRRLEFYLNGKAAELPTNGLNLGGHRVTTFAANGETGIRVDYLNQTVVTITPMFWSAHNVYYINVAVSQTKANEGIMGYIPKGAWLPRLRDGSSLGPKPATLAARYQALYRKFADSWRLTGKTSLFTYAPGTSTATYTDQEWPAEKPPCKLITRVKIPGMPVLKGLPTAEAERICRPVRAKDLHENCVFDVATTGDTTLVKGYLLAEELRLYGVTVRITATETSSQQNRAQGPLVEEPNARNALLVMARVLPLTPGRPTPTGTLTFYIDDVRMNRPVELDDRGRARFITPRLETGEHTVRASYSGGGKFNYHTGSSPHLAYNVGVKLEQITTLKPSKRSTPQRRTKKRK